ncbi:MAG: response regulator [Thermodesulfobacteriota bacterium]
METPLSVLILEDSPDDAELMALRLSQEGFRLDWRLVDSEPDYVAALKTEPDLILADWTLPKFSGLRALQLMRETSLDIPFVIVSGSIGEEAAVDALRSGAYDYVLKDRPGRLGTAVRRALSDKHLREERLRDRQALERSEETLRAIVENAMDGILVADAETKRFVIANQAICRMLRYSREELLRLGVQDIHPPADLDYVTEQFRRQMGGEISLAVDIPVKRKDGSVFIADINSTPIDLAGRTCLLGFFRDITERKRAEESLRESEKNARQLALENAVMAEIARIVASTLKIDEVYTSFAEEVRKLVSFDRIVINVIDAERGLIKNVYMAGEEVQHRKVGEFYALEGSGSGEMVRTGTSLLIQAEDFTPLQERFPLLRATFEAGFKSILDVPLFSKGRVIGGLLLRSRKPYAYTEREVRLTEKIASQIAGAIANAQLYTERIHAEKERAALEAQFRQAQKMEAVGRLAGGVAHDFNNMLGVIIGHSEMSLLEIGESHPLREGLQEILRAARRSADLTRQLLAFARRQTVNPVVLDLNDAITAMLKMLRRLIGEDIDLVWVQGHELWPVKIDPSQIDQILANLVVNARDAISQAGKVTIETNKTRIDQAYCAGHAGFIPGEYVLLAVSDNGSGMSKDVLEHIFEPFFTTKTPGQGTGLGLSTVYGIVKQNEGFINVYSEPGEGTTFKIYLPRLRADTIETPKEPETRTVTGGRETVLMVEDEASVLLVGKAMLESLGYTVLAAGTPVEAIRLAETHSRELHLLLTDVVMPEMNGKELAERITSHKPGLKCLFMSGYTANVIAHHSRLDRGVRFIQKPFSREDLARKVREALDA